MKRPDELVASLRDQPLLVVGDVILDRYVQGDAPRLSPEAPVPVIRVQSEELRGGGAANVAANIASLGARPEVVGVIGEDDAGRELCKLLERSGISAAGLVPDPGKPTIEKTRILARHQQVVRFDREVVGAIGGAIEQQLCARIAAGVPKARAAILSDYGKGVVTPQVVAAICRCEGPVLVDPKGTDYARYRGADYITPNAIEAEAATGIACTTLAGCREAAQELLAVGDFRGVIITRGAEGIFYRTRDGQQGVAPTRARGVFDVTGAGDTVIAVLSLALAAGLELEDSLLLANAAAGLVVEQLGAAVVSGRQLASALIGRASTAEKVKERDEARAEVRRQQAQGREVVMTNGCFDLLHAGHVQSLEFARSQGDFLVVAVNSDASVRRQKGPERPFVGLNQRMRVLGALGCVDLVVGFEDDTPAGLIEQLCPDVLVKGADWQDRGVVGQEFVEQRGGRVVLAPLLDKFSTTHLVEAIQRAAHDRG